ncbi:hypothetical protein CDL12_28174 [Handroanthus impetiginosus]|uniref:Uncharacterized protein n=1 Tax=Handroanthus impetiginosus TaxID=429701 RepID=A0A2G9G216_9LAMI|nr:hypothetical protein CDL12_28174 [Handroanthus impetiginosus]
MLMCALKCLLIHQLMVKNEVLKHSLYHICVILQIYYWFEWLDNFFSNLFML